MGDGAPLAGGQPAAAPGGSRLTIVPDVRSNSLLVRSDNPARIQMLRGLVGGLDVPGAAGGSAGMPPNALRQKLVDHQRHARCANTHAAHAAFQIAGLRHGIA
jgi:general secretion pathway protein D